MVLTRAAEDSKDYALALESAGVPRSDIFIFPCLEFEAPNDSYAALDAALRRNQEYLWVIFLSQKSAEVFFERLLAIGGHFFHLHLGLKIAVIGEATRRYIESELNFPVDFSPSEFNSDIFIQEFTELTMAQGLASRILLPRTAMVKDDFVERLESETLFKVDIVDAYTTKCPSQVDLEALSQVLLEEPLITFTSSQIVRNFMQVTAKLDRKLLSKARILSLGPKTTKTLREYSEILDLSSLQEAKPSSLDAMRLMIKSDLLAHRA